MGRETEPGWTNLGKLSGGGIPEALSRYQAVLLTRPPNNERQPPLQNRDPGGLERGGKMAGRGGWSLRHPWAWTSRPYSGSLQALPALSHESACVLQIVTSRFLSDWGSPSSSAVLSPPSASCTDSLAPGLLGNGPPFGRENSIGEFPSIPAGITEDP